MIASSDIAGTYAPPAVHEPITTALCAIPSADIVVVHAVRGELRQLEKRAARIDQSAYALPRQQLPTRSVPRPRSVTAAFLDRRNLVAQIGDERRHRRAVLRKRRITRGELRFK